MWFVSEITARQSTRLASKLSHRLYSVREWRSSPITLVLSRQRAYTLAYGQQHSVTWAVDHTSHHVFCRLPPQPTFYMGYYSFYRPRKDERLSRLVGWPIADGLPT